jgi:hypothetical protein
VKDQERFQKGIVGRGAAGNPKNRFERIEVEPEPRALEGEEPHPETVYSETQPGLFDGGSGLAQKDFPGRSKKGLVGCASTTS